MASASNPSSKRLPSDLMELLDIAIFTLASQTGLRSTDKVRGDPVIEGVCAFFGDLLQCANDTTLALFEKISPSRLGSWKPGANPTKEIIQLISSRLQRAKSNDFIRETTGPKVPQSLLEREESFDVVTEQLKVEHFPRCWRCHKICRFCKEGKDWIFVPGFRDE